MPSNVEEHILKLRDKLSGKLSNISSKVDKLRGSVLQTQGTLSNLGALASRAFSGVAIAAVGKQILTLGVEMEQTRVAFATFLGDAEKGNKLISELNEFANITPFNNAEVLKSGRLLLAAGIEADGVTKQLKTIGDVAAGANVPITELAAIFQKGFSKGKIQGEQLDQFAERGINIIPELAKALGVGEDAVRDLGSKGQITRDHLVEAFRSMSEEGGTFFNLMEKQSKTVGGRFSTFVGKLQLIGIEIGEKLLPIMGSFIDVGLNVINFLQENTEAILNLFKWVGKIAAAFVIYKTVLVAVAIIQKLHAVGLVLMRIRTVMLNRGVRSTIMLMKGLRLAIAKTGIGLLALALAEIAISFIDFGDDIEGANNKLDEFGNKIKGIQNLAGQRIFDKLLGINVDESTGEITSRSLEQFKSIAAKLKTEQLRSLQGFLEEAIPEAKRGITQADTPLLAASAQSQLDRLTNSLSIVSAELAKTGTGTGTGTGGFSGAGKGKGNSLKSGLATVRSGAPKNITINIDSLIEEQVFNTSDLKESASRVKDAVTRALLEALNDAQVIAR